MDVLVVDDSLEVLDLLERTLAKDGHLVRVAASIAEARTALATAAPDVMVLDVMLTDGTGVELCRSLREDGARFPILLLTAHGEVPRRVAGLDAGADDFLAKPFAIAELRARLRALGRRGPLERAPCIELGDVRVSLAGRRATRGDELLPVTAREWAVLELLISRRGRVVARDTILDLVWNEISERSSSSLDVIIARIRRKLGSSAIRTIRGQGYSIDG